MKIASSSIAMASTHSLFQRDEKSESLQMWTGNRPSGQTAASPLAQIANQLKQDILDISAEARRKQQQQLRRLQTTAVAGDDNGYELSDADKTKIQLIQDFVEALTGKKIKIYVPDIRGVNHDLSADKIVIELNGGQGRQSQGWGLAYDFHQVHIEQEQTTFSAAGVVKTADGREINFSMDLSLSRQFMSREDISIRAGAAAIDPLVINFDGAAASLTQTKYAFDLDSDGSAEQVSFVRPGSGFLALDKNGDGTINNGGELFGPTEGDGFAELAGYDADGNNWIDENDPIYDKLRIWAKDESGNDQLIALGAKGIGAIYLGNIDTAFAYKDSANDLQGQLRTSGLFLRENGSAGLVQQIDLAV
jgi:hypothetical protein